MSVTIKQLQEEIAASQEVLNFLKVRQRENLLFLATEAEAKSCNEDPVGYPAHDPSAAQVLVALLHRLRRLEERVRVLEPDHFEPTFKIPDVIKKD